MRKLVVLLIFCFIVFYAPIVFAAFPDNVVENTKSAVVALYSDENLEYFRASGFFIDSSGTVITAKHVVENYPRLWARLYDGRKLELIPVRFQERDDLAIMLPKIPENKKTSFPYLKFGDIDNLAVGQQVMAVGNSFGSLWQVLYGNIENLSRKIIMEHNDLILTAIEFNIIVPDGFSGSPLVGESGKVLGINIAKSKVSSGYNASYAVSLVEIKLFIEEFHRKSPGLIKKF